MKTWDTFLFLLVSLNVVIAALKLFSFLKLLLMSELVSMGVMLWFFLQKGQYDVTVGLLFFVFVVCESAKGLTILVKFSYSSKQTKFGSSWLSHF